VLLRHGRPRHQHQKLDAVELALILPDFLILLTFSLFIGRLFWHYSVMERAANNAARYRRGARLPMGSVDQWTLFDPSR